MRREPRCSTSSTSHKGIANRIFPAIPFRNAYPLEKPVRVRGVEKPLLCASRPAGDSLLGSGFDPFDLSTGLVALTTCKSSTCFLFVRVLRNSEESRGGFWCR